MNENDFLKITYVRETKNGKILVCEKIIKIENNFTDKFFINIFFY